MLDEVHKGKVKGSRGKDCCEYRSFSHKLVQVTYLDPSTEGVSALGDHD